MRVLILSQYFWPESFRINEVAQSLSEAGCAVTVLTGQPNYPDGRIFPGYRMLGVGREEVAACTVYRVPLAPRGRGGALRLAVNYVSFVVSASVIGSWLLRRQRFDVILVYGISPILQAIPGIVLRRVTAAALVPWVQDLWPQSLQATGFVRSPRLLRMVERVVRWIYRRSDLLLVQSRGFVPIVSAMCGGTPVEYHPNPGESAFHDPQSAAAPALRLKPGFNVVFAGNLGTAQALDTVVSAAQLLANDGDVHFVLIGSGSRSEWLQAEVQRRGLGNVEFPGRYAPADMPAILAQASVLLVTLARSPVMSQTIPSKIQAYLAAGRPLIAALDGEGAAVVAEAGAGLTCPAEDGSALADAIRRMRSATPQERHEMGERGRLYYQQHFEPSALALQLMRKLASIAESRNSIDRKRLSGRGGQANG